MEEQSFLDRLMGHLRSTCKYYTGYPKDLGPSRVIHFTSEREFVQLLHQGHPVVVAFTIRGNYTMHLDRVLEEAAAEFYPNVKFMRRKMAVLRTRSCQSAGRQAYSEFQLGSLEFKPWEGKLGL
ncbi:hypothetical protein COLO4_32845 [Corchorus olitorius]|uniref:Uncharacterized protein n=1 Tax=Corchorus olitorius TaxID=93759 RepID=A0A1R3GXM8_9ROSI|nr:hypothetical protein COLO4_32845 [Corchorus olitorius]